MSPHEITQIQRRIQRYEASAEAWMYAALNFRGGAAENVPNYAKHLQTLAECLKLDLLEDTLPAAPTLETWRWPR